MRHLLTQRPRLDRHLIQTPARALMCRSRPGDIDHHWRVNFLTGGQLHTNHPPVILQDVDNLDTKPEFGAMRRAASAMFCEDSAGSVT